MDFRGQEVTAAQVTFQPTPRQRPRPPVWIGCNWPGPFDFDGDRWFTAPEPVA